MKILIFGATGMLGSGLYKYLNTESSHQVFCTSRSNSQFKNNFSGVDISDLASCEEAIKRAEPDIVLNAIGVIKQKKDSEYSKNCIKVNAVWPNQLEVLSDVHNFKTIHFSTDCVFKGTKGMYLEIDAPDAEDIYAQAKSVGEITGRNSITLRTSIIGHELRGHVSLIDWFLAQTGEVRGFTHAYFSGLPTYYLAHFLDKYLFKNLEISGLWHLSAAKISKYDLLCLVKEVYGLDTKIVKDDSLKIDRSLDSSRIQKKLDFSPLEWKDLVRFMHKYKEI